jgi:hypothetical protein
MIHMLLLIGRMVRICQYDIPGLWLTDGDVSLLGGGL